MKRVFLLFSFLLFSTASLFAVPFQDIHMTVTLTSNTYNTNKHMWYPSITNAIAQASNNNTIIVYQSAHNEFVRIAKFTNLTLISKSWLYSQVWTNVTIDATGFQDAIQITNSKNIKIEGFLIKNANSDGIALANTTFATLAYNKIVKSMRDGIRLAYNDQNNFIFNNKIITNLGSGVGIWSNNVSANTIMSNDIEKNAFSNKGFSGITVIDGPNNNIINNTRIAFNIGSGIGLYGHPQNTRIQGNQIISNYNSAGISLGTTNYRGNLRNNIVTNNIIRGGNWIGIALESIKPNKVVNNIIVYNIGGGIVFRNEGSTNILIQNNLIKSNGFANVGIDIQVASIATNRLNSIIGQQIGIRYAVAGTLVVVKNNFVIDSTNFDNLTGSAVKLTNNWWNFTVAASNAKRIAGNGLGYSNFMPYRIFGPFDITPNANTTTLPIITSMTALSGITTATLKWNKEYGAPFARYFVFRSQTPGVTNLIAGNVIWSTNNANGTNFVDTPPTAGNWYYHVTALDTTSPFTNECWYSFPTTGALAIVGSYSIVATNTNLSYAGLAFNFQTASNVIWISNNGSLPCHVSGQVNNFTNNVGVIPVWKVTNLATSNNRMQIRYSMKTNNVQTPWTTVSGQAPFFLIPNPFPLNKVMYLYIEMVTPTASSTLGPYRSRFRVLASN